MLIPPYPPPLPAILDTLMSTLQVGSMWPSGLSLGFKINGFDSHCPLNSQGSGHLHFVFFMVKGEQ